MYAVLLLRMRYWVGLIGNRGAIWKNALQKRGFMRRKLTVYATEEGLQHECWFIL